MYEIKREVKTINGAEILCLRLYSDGKEIGSMQQAQNTRDANWETRAEKNLYKMCGIHVL